MPGLNSNSPVGLAKLTASLLTDLRSLESLENVLLLAVEGLGDLPNLTFSEEWVKEYAFRGKKATENRIGLKQYALRFRFNRVFLFLFSEL